MSQEKDSWVVFSEGTPYGSSKCSLDLQGPPGPPGTGKRPFALFGRFAGGPALGYIFPPPKS
ncbi:MAG: hypothetical protein LBQ12_12695 [Deltaproteobacteria bacterium]|nr:hypothetical protein [Deltaproteobacteria bacterium]